MLGFIVVILLGLVCIVIGILNTKGNLSMLHSYHWDKVRQEDILPFGKLVGRGMMVVGSSLLLNGVLSIVSLRLDNPPLLWIGTALLFVGIAVGCGIAFYAMKKYNNGIF
jgi:uncharacterized membrane protein HdeD (DUF308 family)